MKRKVTELVIILLVYLIQGTFGRTIAIGGIVPNLLIILPVLFGFFKGKNEGCLLVFLRASCMIYSFRIIWFFSIGFCVRRILFRNVL